MIARYLGRSVRTALWIVTAAGVLATGCIAVETHKGASTSSSTSPSPRGGGGTARVAEVTAEPPGPPGSSTCHNLTVTYENDTPSLYRTVRIRCRALDAAGFQVLSEDKLLDGTFIGPLTPGFKLKQLLRMCPPGSDLHFECSVVAAD